MQRAILIECSADECSRVGRMKITVDIDIVAVVDHKSISCCCCRIAEVVVVAGCSNRVALAKVATAVTTTMRVVAF